MIRCPRFSFVSALAHTKFSVMTRKTSLDTPFVVFRCQQYCRPFSSTVGTSTGTRITQYNLNTTELFSIGTHNLKDEASDIVVLELVEGVARKDGEIFTGIGRLDDGATEYTGNYVNGLRHGRGVLLCRDGSKYDGDWVNGKRDGVGILTLSSNQVLKGTFKDGKIYDAKGIARVAKRSLYEGTWVKGVRTGEGTYTTPGGHVLRGIFRNNEIYTGKGVMVPPDKPIMRGTWKKGKFTPAINVTTPKRPFDFSTFAARLNESEDLKVHSSLHNDNNDSTVDQP